MNKEFYIGWLPNSPAGYSRHTKKTLFILLVLVLITAVTIALLQKKFNAGNFEFGKLTEVKGIYFNKPVPMIKVIAGEDIWGNPSYISIPLVGYGKYGADGIIADIEKEKKLSLNSREIILKGTLLYNDGKTLMQVDANDSPLISVSSKSIDAALLPLQTALGNMKVKGEIIDPKCYFGVMKPGEGKVHKDCAARCIAGGIPPMMMVRNGKGEKNYYLLLGSDGEKINSDARDYLAEPVEIEARLVKWDDWIVMYANDKKTISRIAALRLFKTDNDILYCLGKVANK